MRHCLQFVTQTCADVKQTTISHCWLHAGIVAGADTSETEAIESEIEQVVDDIQQAIELLLPGEPEAPDASEWLALDPPWTRYILPSRS